MYGFAPATAIERLSCPHPRAGVIVDVVVAPLSVALNAVTSSAVEVVVGKFCTFSGGITRE